MDPVKDKSMMCYFGRITFRFEDNILNPFLSANERTEMKLKIYLSEAWMCSEFGMLITDVERERVKYS